MISAAMHIIVSYVYTFCRIEGIKTFWKEYSLIFLLFMFMVMVQNVKYDSMFCFIHILCKQPFQLLHAGYRDGSKLQKEKKQGVVTQ